MSSNNNNESHNLEIINHDKNKKNLIIGLTGSVATIKAKLLVESLINSYNIIVITTETSLKFLSESDIQYISSKAKIYNDKDEWESHVDIFKRSALHIDLRKWADSILIAPCSANTLGKISNGLCDNLLTSLIRAWDYKNKKLIIAPAMNTMMWENPFTSRHIETMKQLSNNVLFIDPIQKKLFCGDIGMGAMEEVPKIVEYIIKNV
ncbi:hypothetical protein DICPUDRAFT_54757 [Dictyostelium purpureum]|uniref:Flavoprotein domain-containing protein n=1 Tax=Dictyostelium purpureum TaxID=5786 RepID=F0ZIM3_DICPU|nr:uncharacterized protein DICPUDRAFT_54757 [Dictyostelium purpureum]EGC36191.1 hypothetical protein DICPUDRAFT_54757 [Dictyostelium purpureum]|eukprot:XP_003287258.1 hypothetical protein DICPUDRAFT_54757 [Dictyostelium purpureum]